MTFRIGQKVVCVDDTPNPLFGETPLAQGATYTVTGSGVDARNEPGIKVAECRTDQGTGYFRASRFRAVEERKTSAGYQMLDDARKRAIVPARTRV